MQTSFWTCAHYFEDKVDPYPLRISTLGPCGQLSTLRPALVSYHYFFGYLTQMTAIVMYEASNQEACPLGSSKFFVVVRLSFPKPKALWWLPRRYRRSQQSWVKVRLYGWVQIYLDPASSLLSYLISRELFHLSGPQLLICKMNTEDWGSRPFTGRQGCCDQFRPNGPWGETKRTRAKPSCCLCAGPWWTLPGREMNLCLPYLDPHKHYRSLTW